MKLGDVASLRHGENDRLILPFRGEVLLQTKPKEAGLRTHNAVLAHVVALRTAEDNCSDALFLDRMATPLLLLLAYEAQEAGEAVRFAEKLRRENPVDQKPLLFDRWRLFNAPWGGQCCFYSPMRLVFHGESRQNSRERTRSLTLSQLHSTDTQARQSLTL